MSHAWVLVSSTDARAQGLTDRDRRRLVRAGRWERERRTVWSVGRDVLGDDAAEDAVAAARERHRRAVAAARAVMGPDTVASHESAAFLSGLCDEPPDGVHLTRSSRCTRQHPGLTVHRAGLPPNHVDAGATTAARTVFDLARRRPGAVGLAHADRAVRRGLVEADELSRLVPVCGRWPGGRLATAVVGMVDGASESELESRSRWELARAGVPSPQLQVTLGADRMVGRVDFYWAEHGVVGEADGLGKYTGIAALHAEKLRQEALEQAGFRVVRWTWADVTRPERRPGWLARVARALERS